MCAADRLGLELSGSARPGSYFIGWSNNQFDSLHFRKSLEETNATNTTVWFKHTRHSDVYSNLELLKYRLLK